MSGSQIKAYIGRTLVAKVTGGGSAVGATAPTTAKTTPATADRLTLWDSAASLARKYITWGSLRTALDLVYAGITHASRHAAAGADPVTPAAIGAEAAGAVATHSALTTGVHGVGAGTVATTSDIPAGSDATPQALGSAAAGTGTAWSRADHVHAMPTGTDIPAVAVASLPGSPVTGVVYRLTAPDATALAPPGFYVHDGTGWLCLACSAAYALGNLGSDPSLTLIAGASYTMTVSEEVDSSAIALTRPGHVALTILNASGYAWDVTATTSSGRTVVTKGADDVTEAISTGSIRDDGTYLMILMGAVE